MGIVPRMVLVGFDFDVGTGACGASPDLSVDVYPVRVAGDDLVVELG
jgi:nitrite reductase/ring-hydroxylating ferredoxin subunit